MFSWKNRTNLSYLEIDEFAAAGIVAVFSSRKGGFSEDQYKSLNLAFHVGDNKELVLANRNKFANLFSIDSHDFVCAEQIHGNQIALVDKNQKGAGAVDLESALQGYDGLITNCSQLPIFSFYADCVPIYLYDPIQGVIGLAHSGWPGTYKKIALQLINKAQINFSSKLTDLYLAIGPSISGVNYEVSAELAKKFKSKFPDLIQEVLSSSDREGHYLLDLSLLNKLMIIKKGIPRKNIIMANLCTYANKDDFFSYRREPGETGRMASMMMLP